jgi:hypothetical protein
MEKQFFTVGRRPALRRKQTFAIEEQPHPAGNGSRSTQTRHSSAEIDRRKRPLPAPIRFDKIEPCIKSWDVAQRQPADPGKVALRKEDVAEPAIRRIKPRASFPEGGPTRSADQNSR